MKQSENVELDAGTEKFAQDLRHRFVRMNEDLPGEGFEQQVAASVQRLKRVRNSWRAALCCVWMVIVVVGAPLLIEASNAMGRLTESFYGDLDKLLTSPLGWAASLLLAAWILRKSRVM